jgi:hypothetical protein
MGPEFTAWNQKRQGGCFYIRGEYSYLINLMGVPLKILLF